MNAADEGFRPSCFHATEKRSRYLGHLRDDSADHFARLAGQDDAPRGSLPQADRLLGFFRLGGCDDVHGEEDARLGVRDAQLIELGQYAAERPQRSGPGAVGHSREVDDQRITPRLMRFDGRMAELRKAADDQPLTCCSL